MEEEILNAYRKAGKIAYEIHEWSKELITPGARLVEIADAIEGRILEQGCGIAFPVNICINDVAAHYAPKLDDETVLDSGDIVSVDIGVHVEGYIADTARTYDLSGDHKELLSANEEALDAAIELVAPGVMVKDLGRAVKDTLASYGLKPIENLTGHQVEQYELHAGISIPNIEVPYDWTIEEGMVLAIEPFATDGYGRVIESRNAQIYSVLSEKPSRNRDARTIMKELSDREGLPFAERWIARKISPMKLSLALRELISSGAIKAYPTLHEKEKGLVSQFEHTVIVTADGCEVTTKG